jgi:hypothetical protein
MFLKIVIIIIKFEGSTPLQLACLVHCGHEEILWEELKMFVQKGLKLLCVKKGEQQPAIMVKQVPTHHLRWNMEKI